MTRRVGVAGLWHETNTYAPRPATLEDFAAFELLSGPDLLERNAGTGSVIGGFADPTDDELELVPLLSAGAWPSGPADEDTIAALLDRLGTALASAGPLDGLLLNLHGAMVATGLEDVEAEVLSLARQTRGEIPVAAVLDFHANPSPALVQSCDVLVSYDTYPHVDMRERGREARRLMSEILAGRSLRTTLAKVPLLVCPLAQATSAEPMRSLQRQASELGREAGVARVCVAGGFAYSDVERAGISVIAVHDEAHAAAARSLVVELAGEIAQRSGEFAVAREDAATCVHRALQATATPVVLVDVADNVGGGSPGDGTALLAELLAQGATGAVVIIADAEVARLARQLGEGAPIDTLVGAKTDTSHGLPVRIRGRVERLSDGCYRTAGSWMTGRDFSMGNTAVISAAGNTLVVTEHATPPFHREQLTSQGIDPRLARIIVMKGAIAWRAAYGDVARTVIEVATPGVCPVDVSSLPRRNPPASFAP
jgi:microcystin degradation protein MlrC